MADKCVVFPFIKQTHPLPVDTGRKSSSALLPSATRLIL
jgi:hypothetical protein